MAVHLLEETKSTRVRDWWIGVWHCQHHGDATSERSACPAVEILLLSRTRFSEVNMYVNQT